MQPGGQVEESRKRQGKRQIFHSIIEEARQRLKFVERQKWLHGAEPGQGESKSADGNEAVRDVVTSENTTSGKTECEYCRE
jgi:hypothetical protein